MFDASAEREGKRVVGRTRDTGFAVGARRTFPVSSEEAWRLLISPEGVRIWLGDARGMAFKPGETYTLTNNATGKIRVYQPNHHLRLTWQPPGWAKPSTIQVRVIPNGGRTTIAFHQEHLPDADAREQRRVYYAAALDALEKLINA
ncbi:MAG: SRPBCC family protein [Bacteroidota bacterium]